MAPVNSYDMATPRVDTSHLFPQRLDTRRSEKRQRVALAQSVGSALVVVDFCTRVDAQRRVDRRVEIRRCTGCLLYTSDAADEK